MAVPKKRTSKSRQLKRRATIFLTPPGFTICPNCKNEILPHRVCPFCGYYKGKKILEISEKPEKKKKEEKKEAKESKKEEK
jgi:large subunit ribosomal protein L32